MYDFFFKDSLSLLDLIVIFIVWEFYDVIAKHVNFFIAKRRGFAWSCSQCEATGQGLKISINNRAGLKRMIDDHNAKFHPEE